jgi:CHAD domain-containing protein
MRLAELARKVFERQLNRMQLNLDGCVEGVDPIHLHDLRVANRRTRSALTDFRKLLPNEVFEEYQDNFRWIHQITGPVRDLDVGLSHFPDYEKRIYKKWRFHLNPARELLEAKRQVAQEELVVILSSSKMEEILSSWSSLLEKNVLDGSELGLESALEYGGQRIIKRYKKTRARGQKLGKKTPAKKFHDYRIRVKRLRYLIEFFQPVLEQEETARLRTELKRVQDAFGAYQDADVQITKLIQLAGDLQESGSGLEPILALGQLIGVYEKEIRRARKRSLSAVRWLTSESTAREFQSCFKYSVE